MKGRETVKGRIIMEEWGKTAQEKWEGNAGNWHSRSEEMWLTGSRKQILPFVEKHVPKASHIGDLGCGDGAGSHLLRQAGYEVTGMDFSNNMIDLAKRYEGDDLRFVQGDLTSMPFRDHAFNGVMAINSIEWLEDPLEALKEVERVVIPGGYIVIGLLGPTAHPRENAFPRLTGGKAVCNTMMPWELVKLSTELGWKAVDEEWVFKKGVKGDAITGLDHELKQALSFMTLFMFTSPG